MYIYFYKIIINNNYVLYKILFCFVRKFNKNTQIIQVTYNINI